MSTPSIRAEHVAAAQKRQWLASPMLLVVAMVAACSAGLGYGLARYAGAAITAAVVIGVVYFMFVAAVAAIARRVEKQR